MAKYRLHKLAAVAVLIGFAGWIATGEFSSVGSARDEDVPADAAGAGLQDAEQPAALARTVAVVVPPRLQHSRAIRISGQTGPDKRSTLATRAAGVIAELPVRQGDTVEAGDTILVLDAEEKTAAVETAQALLTQREAEYAAAQRLAKSGNVAKLQVDNAFSALASARAQVDAAEAELARTTVKAPFAGIVDRVSVELGGSVMQGGDVATVIALDPVIAMGEISERDLRHVKTGEMAKVRLVNGETVEGAVRYVSRDASPTTRTFPVEIAIANPDRRIPAGMTAEITILAEPTDAVALPRSVVTLSGPGDLGVRAVDKDNKVVFYPIDIVDDTPRGLVLAGIPVDARVIVAGQDLVSDGDTVIAVPADEEMIRKLVGEATGS